ncbi:cytochrome c-type biogenesis protein [Phenylobacterium conjunctum]|jgi:cytochrome c-type biogenesis protein CcmH|uniref:Cytochrome c-type biogenesis protein n=1 Tax=Phenylobacterium conjunctum TaxID=1298959 RepID=A0ABW3T4I6_9CAUL
MRRALAILGAVLCLAAASDPAERLADPAQEARARALFREVRCLVCQNESIDDSQAELASDLRKLVRDEIATGKSDAEVRAYLVSRYGEFVLLKPAISWGNAALWGAPFAVVVLGGALLAVNLRRRRAAEEPELSPEEAARLEALAAETSSDTSSAQG